MLPIRKIISAMRGDPRRLALPAPTKISIPPRTTGVSISWDDILSTPLIDDETFSESSLPLLSYQAERFRQLGRSVSTRIEQSIRDEDYREVVSLVLKLKNPVETLGLPRLGSICGSFFHKPTAESSESSLLRRRAIALAIPGVINDTINEIRHRIERPHRPSYE